MSNINSSTRLKINRNFTAEKEFDLLSASSSKTNKVVKSINVNKATGINCISFKPCMKNVQFWSFF